MLQGHTRCCLVSIAAKLGIADYLAGGPLSVGQLCGELGMSEQALLRMMRGFASCGLLHELPGHSFALTELGHILNKDAPGNLRERAIRIHDLDYHAWGRLLEGARSGSNPFLLAYGEDFYSHLQRHKDLSQNFNRDMEANSAAVRDAVVREYDFSGWKRVVDLGGGRGSLAATLAERYPDIECVLFDLPSAIEQCEQESGETAGPARIQRLHGNMFDEVPCGGGLYILQFVLHNWDDVHCRRILENCRKVMDADSRVLIVESLMPDIPAPSDPIVGADLTMMVLTEGRERSMADYRSLLQQEGFDLIAVTPTSVGIHLLEARLMSSSVTSMA